MAEQRMLLVEPEDMLRRTVSLTARALGLGAVEEAASLPQARRLLREHPFAGAVIAIDHLGTGARDFSLLDQVRDGRTASPADIPIAVLATQADPELVAALRGRDVQRVILKPFRARVLLDAFAALGVAAPATPPAAPNGRPGRD